MLWAYSVRYSGEVPSHDAAAADIGEMLRSSYGVPSADEALGFARRHVRAVLTTARSSEVNQLCNEVAQAILVASRSFEGHAEHLDQAANSSFESAQDFAALATDIDARLDALVAARSKSLWAATPDDTRSLTAQLSALTENFSDIDHCLTEVEASRSAVEQNLAAIRETMRAALAQRNCSLAVVQDEDADSNSLSDLLYALGKESEIAARYQRVAKGPAFDGENPDLFQTIAIAAQGAIEVLIRFVSKTTAATTSPDAVAKAVAAGSYAEALVQANIGIEAVDLATTQLEKAAGADVVVPKEAVEDLQELLKAVEAALDTLCAASREQQRAAIDRSVELHRAAAQSREIGTAMKADAEVLPNELNAVWTPARSAAKELEAIIGAAVNTQISARRRIEDLESALAEQLGRRLDAGDPRLLQRLGIRSFPTGPEGRTAVLVAAVKQETFVAAYGEPALGRLAVGQLPMDTPAVDHHGREVLAAMAEMRQVVPKAKAEASGGIGRHIQAS